jgi:hypothetical protein
MFKIFENLNNLVRRFLNFISFKKNIENNLDNDLENCNLVHTDSSLCNNPIVFSE